MSSYMNVSNYVNIGRTSKYYECELNTKMILNNLNEFEK